MTVLTSTHILSLWACVGRPDREPDWQRVLIVNPILKSFVADQVNGETKTKKGSESTDDVRLSRIRSFAWCPAVRLPSRNDTTAGDSAWGRHMLAVSNDCGQVIILEIKSPHHRIRPSSDIIWQAQVLYCLDPPDNLGRSALLSCLPTTYKEPPPRVDQIAWSPWIRDDAHGRTFSKLAVTVTGKLYHTQVHITIPQDSIVLQVDPYELLSPAETTVAGPIKWSHIEASSSKLHLAACSRGILQCFTFRVPDTNLFDSTSRRISGRWDEVSSLSFGVDADGNTVIHYALFLTELKAEHVTIRLPLDEKESGVASPWQRDIKGEQALFSASEDLVGFVSARTYGISISPLADFVASCVSFHPSDGLEYAIKRAQWSYLNVTRQLPVNIDQLFPFVKAWNHAQGMQRLYETRESLKLISASGTSAETVLFSLQSFHDSTVSATQTDEGKVIKQVAKAISAYPLPATHATECAAQGRSDISNPIMELRRLMLVDEEADIWRAERLFRLAQRDRDTTAVPHVDIVQRLVAGTRNMSRSLSNWDPLSRAMLRNHRLVSSKLAERTGKASHDVEMADTTESEVCTICRGDMPFEALKWARCANGHQSSMYPTCDATMFC